jgi:CHAD domain-containing protein
MRAESAKPKLMATAGTVAGSRAEHRGLTYWMERTLKELEKVRETPDADAVHDLRVAIRRCRSVAAVMQEVDPDAAWPEMKKLGRKLFRQLGELRDTQVLEEWTKKLSAEADPVRQMLLDDFGKKENELRETALRVAAKFDEKAWTKHERTLRRRARLVPPDSTAAECLALERLEGARELQGQAMRTGKPAAWHALRIGVKRFRYTVESLLPARYEEWGEDLKRVQDLLGEVHDLDVLSEKVAQITGPELVAAQASWSGRIATERGQRIETYRQMTSGQDNLWHKWRQGLPEGRRLEAAGLARLRVTSRAMDGNLRRTAQLSRLTVRLFDALRKVHAARVFEERELRKIVCGAARIHGIGAGLGGKHPQKAARKFLRKLAEPAGWTKEEWELLGLVVRYHRGGQPKTKHKAFGALNEVDQARVNAMAGVLRLARALRKSGIETTVGLRVDKSVDALIVQVPGLVDSESVAARLAVGKHLLETCLELPLIVRAAPEAQKVLELPKREDGGQTRAAASD